MGFSPARRRSNTRVPSVLESSTKMTFRVTGDGSASAASFSRNTGMFCSSFRTATMTSTLGIAGSSGPRLGLFEVRLVGLFGLAVVFDPPDVEPVLLDHVASDGAPFIQHLLDEIVDAEV